MRGRESIKSGKTEKIWKFSEQMMNGAYETEEEVMNEQRDKESDGSFANKEYLD